MQLEAFASRPMRFDASRLAEARALQDLITTRRPEIVDSYEDQLKELAEIRRSPGNRGAEPGELWIYYPWRNTLVRLVGESAFVELRTARNLHKTTREEQETLGKKRIGVVGLSVGNAVALTLALERVGGELRIADFDRLSLSNLNRIRSPITHLGAPKTGICAREIAELDPFLEVRRFDEGVTSANLELFFLEGGKLDLVVDECDDLSMKCELRRFARSQRIPVVMHTSDRGLLDVERFDLEPERPIFHGLIDEADLSRLSELGQAEKVPFVLKLLGGPEGISSRAAASLLEIGSSISTWPQLGSEVVMGGAFATDACRRILLGERMDSGRYRLDPAAANPVALPSPARPPFEAGDATLVRVAQSASAAPSGGNSQPWKLAYRVSKRELELKLDPARAHSFLDFDSLASWAALGAAAENAWLASLEDSPGATLEPFPEAGDPLLGAKLRLSGDAAGPENSRWGFLARWIQERRTCRSAGTGTPLPEESLREIALAAESIPGCKLQLVAGRDSLAALGGLLGEGDRFRLLEPRYHEDMLSELRWTPSEAASGDGIDVATLGLSSAERLALEICRSGETVAHLARIGGGEGIKGMSRRLLASSAAAGLLTVAGSGREPYFRGGRAMSRLWLRATSLGVSLQPMSSLPYILARLERGPASDFSLRQRSELERMRERLRAIFPASPGESEILLFRLFQAPDPEQSPAIRSLRRPIGDILEVTP